MNFLIDGTFVLSIYLSALLLDMYMGRPVLIVKDVHATFGLHLWLILLVLGLILFYFIYYLLCEVFIGTTFGQHVSATKVVGVDGNKPGRKQLFLRTLARLIPIDPFTFFARQPVGLHDKLSGTRLVFKQDVKRRLLF
jgi:hypothetical protein